MGGLKLLVSGTTAEFCNNPNVFSSVNNLFVSLFSISFNVKKIPHVSINRGILANVEKWMDSAVAFVRYPVLSHIHT